MKQVSLKLTVLFWAFIILVLLTVVAFETGLLDFGYYAGSGEQAEFLLTTMMELLTLAMVPQALRLFKFQKVHAELVNQSVEAMKKWGVLRLIMLEVPMLVNTLLYYTYANTAFGYMAIIIAITLPFVYPSMNRCMAETTEEES